MSLVTTQRNDMCYCPGCSHGMVLEALGKALDALQRPAREICLVSDIGCIGTADRYFSCHTFHGLHGRSICYAEGIKRARPEVMVVVLIGDGGCGIGTAHLVHAARRRADIKIVVCNNFNFGMTGGQHSATTPCDAKTTTTPGGAMDHPFDICTTVAANGAAFVARQDVFDSRLVEVVEQALRTPGFALVDVWELCTAYFVPANRLNRGSLVELSNKLGMPFGILQQRAEPAAVTERSDRPARVKPDKAPSPPCPPLPWDRRREICVAGSAGQRIRSAVGVIGELAVASGLYAAQQDDFPITVRKGFSVSSLIVARDPIVYTGVDAPDLVILLSEDGVQRFGDLSAVPETSLVVLSDDLDVAPTTARVLRLATGSWNKQLTKESLSLACLSFALVAAELATPRDLRAVAEAALTGSYREENRRAIEVGSAQAADERQAKTLSLA